MREKCRVPCLALGGLLALLVLPSALHAAGCTVDTGSGVAFGSYSPFDTSPLDSTGTITVNCTSPYNATVVVKISAGISNSFTPRTLKSGAHPLSYNLYLDAARSTVWGDGTVGTSYSTQSPADGVNLPLTVYGRIPARQTAWVGSYSDTLVVSVEF